MLFHFDQSDKSARVLFRRNINFSFFLLFYFLRIISRLFANKFSLLNTIFQIENRFFSRLLWMFFIHFSSYPPRCSLATTISSVVINIKLLSCVGNLSWFHFSTDFNWLLGLHWKLFSRWDLVGHCWMISESRSGEGILNLPSIPCNKLFLKCANAIF